MSFAILETRLAEEAVRSVPRRLDALKRNLELCSAELRAPPEALCKELKDLQRIVTARIDDPVVREMLEDVAGRLEHVASSGAAGAAASAGSVPLAPNKRFPCGTGLVSLGEIIMRSEESLDSDEVAVLPRGSVVQVVRPGREPGGRRVLVTHDQEHGTSIEGWVSIVTASMEDMWNQVVPSGLVGEVAAFMYPNMRSRRDADSYIAAQNDVHTLAAEGLLSEKLANSEVISFPSENVSFVLREWRDEDDVERQLLLQLSTAAHNVLTVQTLVREQVEEDHALFETIEANITRTAENTSQAVAKLADARAGRWQQFKWVPDVACFVLVGIAVSCTTHVGLLAWAVRAGIVLSATGATHLTTCTVTEKHLEVMKRLRQRLPDVVTPTPEHKESFITCGKEAARWVLAELGLKEAWSRSFSLLATRSGLPLRSRQSACHRGSAYATHFETRAPAKGVYQLIQRLAASGSMDPECDVCWTATLDADSGTLLRHLTFSRIYAARSFYCICRSGRVVPDLLTGKPRTSGSENTGSDVPEHEQYIFAVASLHPSLFALAGVPRAASEELGDEPLPKIQACGVLVSAIRGGGSHVQVMGDVDISLGCAPSFFTNTAVRHHVLHTAVRLREHIKDEFER